MTARQGSIWRSGVFIWGLAWLLSYFGVRALLEHPGTISTTWLVIIVLIPVIPATLFLLYFIAGMKELDELQRRIQLEALAFAYPLALLMLITLGLLELVVKLNPNDWSYRHVWQYLVLLYLVGLFIAKRRYE
jgi:hypothetical protein